MTSHPASSHCHVEELWFFQPPARSRHIPLHTLQFTSGPLQSDNSLGRYNQNSTQIPHFYKPWEGKLAGQWFYYGVYSNLTDTNMN